MGQLREVMSNLHHIELTAQQEELLLTDLHAIMKINETMNLTRILSEEDGLVLHLEDSLLGLPYINEAPEGLYGDLGTGGGFPGIPVCIMTGRQTLLVDSVKKKVKSLETVFDELGIESCISTYGGRIEDLANERRGKFSVLSARALSSLGSLLELSSPLLKIDGRLVCYKAQPSIDEVDVALSICNHLGFKLVVDETTTLSNGSTRRFFVFEKVRKAEIRLPRRIGMAQKNPLSEMDFKTRNRKKPNK